MTLNRVLLVWQGGYPSEVRLGKMIGSFRRAGFAVALLCRQTEGLTAFERRDEIDIRRVKGLPLGQLQGNQIARIRSASSTPIWLNPLWASALRELVADFAPDVLVARDLPLALLVARTAHRHGLPVILDMAEHYPEAMRSWKKYSQHWFWRTLVNSPLPDWVERRVVEQMDGITVVCDEQKRRLVFDYNYPPERISVVLNTPEISRFESVHPGACNTGPHIFGYHGILCNDRDLAPVLRGFELALQVNPRLRLVLCGDGESADDLRTIWKASSAADRIEFTGRYKPDDLAALYARVDFGIVSLRKNIFTQHTIANKFFDYAALGKPFIYTRLKPLETLMASMRCGLPFEAGDASSIARAMIDLQAANYAQLSENGRACITSRFNWIEDGRALINFLHRVVGQPLVA